MSKKTTKKRKTTPKKTSEQITGVNLVAMTELLDRAYDDNGCGDNASDYRRVYQEELDEQLASRENSGERGSTPALYKLLSDIADFCFVEDVIRRAGFAQGFLIARQLLAGDLTIADVKRAAR